MALVGRLVDIAPNPLSVASRLWDRPGLALLTAGFGDGRCFVACDPCDVADSLDPEPGLALVRDGGPFSAIPRWVGVLPYECRRSLERQQLTRSPDLRPEPHLCAARWLRYPAVAVVSNHVLVVGETPDAAGRLASLLKRPPRQLPAEIELSEPAEPGEAHARRVRAALELIAAGELYQVNLARRFSLRIAGQPHDLLAALSPRGLPPYGVALDLGDIQVVSTSPELFLALEADRRVLTSPIKGTRPRGTDASSDQRMRRELDLDPKERAELVMILDVERNDLGRVAETGTVRMLWAPHVCTLPTVHHRLATLEARLRSGIGRAELLDATLPSGSVTGAPKVRAMEVIAQLERNRRGLYTGALGAVMHDGTLRLAMAIRTLTVRQGEGHYYSGGGIVADSDPTREVEETHWKALQIAALRH